jgi:hypothetical protein
MPSRRKVGLIILLVFCLYYGLLYRQAVYAESGIKAKQDEQYVNIMCCAPPLVSITIFNIPFVMNLGVSIKNLVTS